ncbi:hypothetical protein P691DRAFT_773942 [Macrolepiota fuliginosa MF-IS2]|uniref:Ribonuclease H1 N-terminal domain-containing protein n=1 Tax=Macrolepiota fuliginosa MF-IS2 TaxID=1400762 RepID=A0A9P5XHG7_9AGAR|nr:hypothetical protein P691DRAFT_773942 [Macrolepiota fuliginosa MF-IS2]
MVKRYYVVTAGPRIGIFYDHWTNVAPYVKNKQDCVWQGASSREEAEELFEQARAKGHIREISYDYARSPTSSTSRTGSMQKTSSGSSASTRNPQHPGSRYTSAPRFAGSQSEGHVWNNASHYVPTTPATGELNTNYSAWERTSGGSKSAKVLARTYSEPSQYMPTSNPRRQSPSQVEIDNTGVHARVESPSWLASYPDDDNETFITPPLSPITSPVVSSRLLGPSKSEPASTFSASFAFAGATGQKLASDDGSDALNFRSPKPVQQSASFPRFSPRPQESSTGRVGSSTGGRRRNLEGPVNVETSRTTRQVDTHRYDRDKPESLTDLVNTVDRLVKDLRIHVFSPSTTIDDDLMHDDVEVRPCDPKRHSTSASLDDRIGRAVITSPRSQTARKQQTGVPELSKLKNLNDMGVPSHSVLFSHSRGPSSPALRSIYSQSGSTCKNCNGTGYNAEGDTPLPDKTGLSQPNLVPFHSHNAAQDPRSPFMGSKKLRAPVSGSMTFGRPSLMTQPEVLSVRSSPVIISPVRRG